MLLLLKEYLLLSQMDHVGCFSLGPRAYFTKSICKSQVKTVPPSVAFCCRGVCRRDWLPEVVSKKCLLHGYLLITSGLTIWVALLWPPCGHYFPLSYIVINDFGHTDKVLPKTANHDLIRCSRVTSTSSQTTSSNR